jgi:hypothetical protein
MKIILSVILFLIASSCLVNYSQYTRVNKNVPINDDSYYKNSKIPNFNSSHLILEGGRSTPFYVIGPEINTQLSGFFDFQSNGECKHYINRVDQFTMHCVYMYRTDSAVVASRRSGYSFSTDGGSIFTFVTNIPGGSSGHPSLTVKPDGSAVICNYYSINANSYGGLHYDVAPGAGTFTTKDFQAAMLFPGCARLSNNNIFTVGIAHPVDTVTARVFNFASNNFITMKKFYLSEVLNVGMTVTYAAGPNGKVIIVFNPYADDGGNFGLNRMFISSSVDNGTTWSTPSVLFNPSIINGDTVAPYFGVDAIYDQSGNYYVAFNSIAPSGEYSSAKLWVIKNGGTPALVAQHTGINGIPEAANTVLNSDAGICTIDHPSLSLSADGLCLYAAYAVQFQNDTLNGFNKCHIYVSRAKTSDLAFASPIRITNSGPGSFDERFPSLNQVTPDLGGSQGSTLFLVYQKDPQPGSCVNGDNAPTSRSTLIFRNIFTLNCEGLPGVTNIGNEIPGNFSLHQNFPNPFNPETKIRFELPKRSYVNLNVYDVTGKLITSLIYNELLEPGLKEINFNSSSFASGVYFYTLTAGSGSGQEFIESKRMILVK